MAKTKHPRRGKMQKGYVLPRPYIVLGQYLAAARIRAGLTQRDVSVKLDYSSAQFISNFECGVAVPPLKKLKKIVELYDLNGDQVADLILDAEAETMKRVLLGRGSSRSR